MPFYIEENNIRRRKYFDLISENDCGKIVERKRIQMKILKYRRENFLYIMLYDQDMNVVKNACLYLNHCIKQYSESTRFTHATVIRLFHVFLLFSGYNIESLSQVAIERLTSFLCGYDFRAEQGMKVRSHNSVNIYIGIIRQYLRSCKIYCEAIETKINDRYKVTLRTNFHADDHPRPYISPSEYLRLKNIAEMKNDLQAVLLVHLMYIYGLRIGECLGLTVEDVSLISSNGTLIPCLILRNRLSDKKYQFAKCLGHITSRNQYKSKDYAQSNITITRDFYANILQYTDMVLHHGEVNNRLNKSVADIVSNDFGKEENHYIFLNSRGNPLSQQTWNIRLKKYFLQAGIPIDVGAKKNNLSHRLRHGCAMYYLHFAKHKLQPAEVSRLLRHKSLLTTMIYEKMTIEDELKAKEEFQDDLFTKIPNLTDRPII